MSDWQITRSWSGLDHAMSERSPVETRMDGTSVRCQQRQATLQTPGGSDHGAAPLSPKGIGDCKTCSGWHVKPVRAGHVGGRVFVGLLVNTALAVVNEPVLLGDVSS